jgi:hypothetical protein
MYLFFVSGLMRKGLKIRFLPLDIAGVEPAKNLRTQIWGGKDRGFCSSGQEQEAINYSIDSQTLV